MKKFTLITLALLLLLTMAGWSSIGLAQPDTAVAAQTDLDSILARAAVKGYLTSLKHSLTGQSSLTDFYLTDDAAASDAAQSLTAEPVTDFEVVDEEWVDDNTYRVVVVAQPGDQIVIAEATKVTNRWKVSALTLGDADDLPADTAMSASGADFTAPGVVAKAAATATVLDLPINVRSGPGLAYAPQLILEEGEQVDIIGISGLGTWFQVTRNGETLGWISASPKYVEKSPMTAQVPIVSAPGLGTGGGKMVLQTRSGGPMYLVNADFSPFADGSAVRYIADGIDPALSPDGSQVAYTRWGGGEVGELMVYDLATGQERVVLGEMFEPKSPAWSLDAEKIIVSFQNGGRRNAERSCTKYFNQIPPGATDINVGSETGRICYTMSPDTHWKLRLINVADGSYQDMTSDQYSFAPTWDPANDWRVLFASSVGLQQLDVNRDVNIPFTTDRRDRTPVFSPDGSQVAVTFRQHMHWEVYTIDAINTARTRLTPVSPLVEIAFNSASPAWSPSGNQIAFVSDRSGEWEFWVMNADGSSPRLLLPASIAEKIPVEYNGVDERLISWGK